ncbi:MAG: amidase [Myxococcota bacterium]
MPEQKPTIERLNGWKLRSALAAVRFGPIRRAVARQIREDLGIDAALALDTNVRSPMPLDYKPVRARPSRVVAGDLALAPAPTAVPSARGWTERYASGEATPIEVVELAISQARRLAGERPSMSCFTYLDEEGAMRDARASTSRWANGEPLGPLDGVVVPVKEMVDIDGSGYRLGTGVLPVRPDAVDQTAVARLRAAGAIILGHTVMVELGLSPMGTNVHRTMPRNAQAADRVAGGSSTGSVVAVASGLAPVTLACDGGGSVRIPASFNGVFSIKPTAGRVSRCGDGFDGSMDHFGPIGASPHDLAVFIETCGGPDRADPITQHSPELVSGEFVKALGRGVSGMRIGVLNSEIDDADPEVAKACREALRALEEEGAELFDVSFDLAKHASAIGFTVIGLETMVELDAYRPNQWRELGPEAQLMMHLFDCFHAGEYIDAQCLRTTLRAQVAALLRDVDVLALPTTASVAPRVTDKEMTESFSDIDAVRKACRFTFLGNLTGLPCGQAPVGSGEAGLPVGLQIIGDAFDEASVLAVLAHLERAGAARVREPRVSARPF